MFVLVMYLLAGVLQLQEVFAVSTTSASSLETNVKTDVADGVQSGQQQHIYIEKILNDVDGSSSDNSLLDLQQSLSFYPPSLDFGTWSVGTARSHLVTLVNKNANRSVHLSSISGQTPVFYSSFYEDKIVPPKGNTTFNVVFLPRNNGLVETNLLVHTSFGQAKFAVRGIGADCPYRLRPLIGIKAPLNATINPEIIMYNPHQRPIQIVEVYSSGGQFQLELPSGGQAGPQTLWEIPPLSSKPIIRIRFHGIQTGNFSAYIRIKIAGFKEKDEDILVVPVEFEILPNYGIYSPNPIIDFGRLIIESDELSGDNKNIKEIKLNLVNSGKEKFEIIDYKLKRIPDFFEIKRSERLLQLNTEKIKDNYNVDGELIIISRLKKQSQSKQQYQENGKFVEYPIKIKAEIFKGNLEFERNTTIFITGLRNNSCNSSSAYRSPLKSEFIEREFKVKNKFNLPIKINKIVLEKNDTKVFSIVDFRPSIAISPNNIVTLFKINVLNKTSNFNTTLKIITNITTYELPLVICTGLLQRYTSIDAENFTRLSDDSILDFGVVPFGDFSHFGFILIKNINPISVQYMKWNFTSPLGVYYHSMFLGCLKPYKSNKYRENIKLGMQKDIEGSQNWSGVKLTTTTTVLHDRFSLCMNITSGETAVFGLAIQSFSMKSFTGTFKIWTEVEEIETLVKFVTVAGRIKVNQGRLHFKECFPGKRCSADIFVHSSFVKPMRVNWITVSVPGLIFEHHSQNGLPEIVPNAITDLGHIHFDPTSVCGNKCYLSSSEADEPEVSASNTKQYKNSNDLYFDEIELRRRTDMYRRLKSTLQMITISLNTSENRVFDFNATVDLIWPKLVSGVQTIPTTEIGQTYNGLILITNPSSDPLEIELKLSDPSKAKTTSLSLPMEVVEICVYCYLTDEKVFSLSDVGRMHIIKPNSFISIGVKFKATTVGIYSTLLHIKNNLTLYEAVWITGKAVQPQFRFGNRKPGSQTALLFEINEKHLSICDRSLSNDEMGDEIDDEPIIISTKRTFTARNNGEVPILIDSFHIGDRKCEGYGFKILDCNSFVLKANSSRKIDISFTPDFTAMRINRPLILITNLSYVVNYTLLATIPSDCIEKCARILQRPFWEYYFRKGSAGFLIIGSFFILTAAFVEADKILKDHIRSMSRDKGAVQPPLDLRNITSKNNNSRAMNFSNITENDEEKYSPEKVTTPMKNSTTNSNSCVRKRNSKRNIGMSNGTSVSNVTSKNKTWADELAKKVTGNKSKNDTLDSTVSNKPLVQEVKGKEEKSSYQNKKIFTHSNKDSSIITTTKTEKKFIESTVPQIDSDTQHRKSLNNSKCDPTQSDLKRSKNVVKKLKSSPEPSVENFKESSSNDLSVVKNHVNDNRNTKSSLSKEGNREKQDLPVAEIEVLNISIKEPEDKKVNLDNQKRTYSVLQEELIIPLTENNSNSQGEPPKKQSPTSSPPFTNNSNGSNSSKSNQKKYSKTPGRERKKGQNEAKRSERKESKYRTNLQSFFQNDQNNSQGNQNVWNLNQGSFSDVVSSSKRSGNSMARTLEMGQQKRSLDCSQQPQPFSKLMDLDWNEADLKNHETFGSDAMSVNEEPDVSMTLGPIGSRKSPTSLWEPLVRSHHPTPSFLQQSTNPNSSFFSSNFPIASNYESSNSELQSFGGTSGLLDHIISEATHQKQRQANEALISLLQQQSQHGNNNHSGTSHNSAHIQKSNNWQTTDHSWNPMNFNSTSSGSTRVTDGGPERRNYINENSLIGSSSFIPDGVDVWQNANAIRRPPPGLETNSRPGTPIQYNINSTNGNGNNIHNNTTETGEENIKNKSYLNNASNSNNNNSNYTVAFQGAVKSGNTLNSPVTMQTFDPFSSLSSIWSDTWINNSNKNSNNNNNNSAK